MLKNLEFIRTTGSLRGRKQKSTNSYVRNYQKNMQNKPNFLKAEIDTSSVFTKDYENLWLYKSLKNKPNSKPIQSQNKPNCRKPKNEHKKCYNNELQRFCPACRAKKQSQNKPNSNPIQSQFKPNFNWRPFARDSGPV